MLPEQSTYNSETLSYNTDTQRFFGQQLIVSEFGYTKFLENSVLSTQKHIMLPPISLSDNVSIIFAHTTGGCCVSARVGVWVCTARTRTDAWIRGMTLCARIQSVLYSQLFCRARSTRAPRKRGTFQKKCNPTCGNKEWFWLGRCRCIVFAQKAFPIANNTVFVT